LQKCQKAYTKYQIFQVLKKLKIIYIFIFKMWHKSSKNFIAGLKKPIRWKLWLFNHRLGPTSACMPLVNLQTKKMQIKSLRHSKTRLREISTFGEKFISKWFYLYQVPKVWHLLNV
jgi:hypothetical protein